MFFWNNNFISIFADTSSTALQLPLRLSRLMMSGLSSIGFKSIRVFLLMHGSLFNDTHLVAKDSLKLYNPLDTCLIRLGIILYYS